GVAEVRDDRGPGVLPTAAPAAEPHRGGRRPGAEPRPAAAEPGQMGRGPQDRRAGAGRAPGAVARADRRRRVRHAGPGPQPAAPRGPGPHLAPPGGPEQADARRLAAGPRGGAAGGRRNGPGPARVRGGTESPLGLPTPRVPAAGPGAALARPARP